MSRIARFVLGAGGALLLAVIVTGGSGASSQGAGNTITVQGFPNPNPVVTKNWGQLPAGSPVTKPSSLFPRIEAAAAAQ